MDRKLALMELDKLALYCDAGQDGEPVEVTAQMLDALGAESEDTAIDPAVNCILNGDIRKLGEELARIAELGLNEVGIVLAIQRRVGSLAKLAQRAADARSISDFVKNERSIFFGEKPNYTAQLSRWHGARLESLNRRLIDLHQQLLYNSQSAEILFRQEMAVIALAAARGGGR
jgi:DNA polymerase III subunit delta